MDQIFPPWTPQQIKALEAHQHNDRVHPYTCANNGDDVLIPTTKGWICPRCDYTQSWAYNPLRHPFQLEYRFPPPDGRLPDDLEVDSNGYPNEARLAQIRSGESVGVGGRWLVETFPRLAAQLAPYGRCEVKDDVDIFDQPEKCIVFCTGGWSGCESFIHAVLSNTLLRAMYFSLWRRGGYYEFRVAVSQMGKKS